MTEDYPKFKEIEKRLEYLELWYELGIRPEKNLHPGDMDLSHSAVDDVIKLKERCISVRKLMNQNLPPHEIALDNLLMVKASTIPSAGMGLFFTSPGKSDKETEINDNKSFQVTKGNIDRIRENEIICYYTGHRHNLLSSRLLVPDKSYLLNIEGDIWVDPLPMKHIKARYINDPLNEKYVNCKYVPQPDKFRCAVVATRDIFPGVGLKEKMRDLFYHKKNKIYYFFLFYISTS